MTLLEDKSVVGGSGLATERKTKTEISVQKAYDFLVRTWVRIPPAPLDVLWASVFIASQKKKIAVTYWSYGDFLIYIWLCFEAYIVYLYDYF